MIVYVYTYDICLVDDYWLNWDHNPRKRPKRRNVEERSGGQDTLLPHKFNCFMVQ